MLIVAALTVVGVVLRLVVARQSLFGDELSTHYVVAGRDLWDVIATVHTDAEITPPLYFAATWLATRIDTSPELWRLPSLIAGAAAMPLVYLVGLRTVGRRAALLATALTALSPFMIYYSAEARGYELMVVLVLTSTLALLLAVDSGKRRWWVVYAACAAGAVYTHYTSVFALGGQLLWLLWAHPESRKPALIATACAALAFAPWIAGLQGDLNSATTDILSALQPFEWRWIRISVTHWAIGHPYALRNTGLSALPGEPALVLFALGLLLALAVNAGGWVRERRDPRRIDRRVLLVVVLALSVPVGEAIASAIGSNLLGTRNLAASWPGYALALAAFLLAGGRRLSTVAAALVLATFAIGAAKMVDEDFRRHDLEAVAGEIERTNEPGDVVVDGASLSPGGIPTSMQVALDEESRMFFLGRQQITYDPFRVVAEPPPNEVVLERAATAAEGRKLYLVLIDGSPVLAEADELLRGRFRRGQTLTWPGIDRVLLAVYEPV